MDDPVKIIHKYKNGNGRIQYHIHIFIGDIVDDACMRVLRKIKDIDFYSALTTLEQKDRDILTKNYGDFWYEKFFNSYHINNIKELSIKNSARTRELTKIYGKEWIKEHFFDYKKRLETIMYSYETVVKDDHERKTLRKILQKQVPDTDDIIDYTTFTKADSVVDFDEEDVPDPDVVLDEADLPERITPIVEPVKKPISLDFSGLMSGKYDFWKDKSLPRKEELLDSESDSDLDKDMLSQNVFSSSRSSESEYNESDLISSLSMSTEMMGGADESGEPEPTDPDTVNPNEFDFENSQEDERNQEFESEVEKDLEDVDIIFSSLDDADKNLKATTKEIKKAISDESYDKINKRIVEFDTSQDSIMFDSNLKDVFHKNYITHQYIYKDDTVKKIRTKICTSFKNNKKFGDNTYIIPSYQYLWSEYRYKGKIEKVMIGQKWIVKNDVLKLDVEPNTNLAVYEDLRGNLKLLRDNIRRQGKIKREDDDNSILFDYEGFYTYNEIYMIDVYNELGLNYEPNFEELRNLSDVYVKIYFPHTTNELKSIMDFLLVSNPDSKKILERNKLRTLFETNNNDLILENEIMKTIEMTRKKNVKEYQKIFQENYVNQSAIRVYLLERNKKADLFRIFENFELNQTYPFIQYQPTDGIPRYRYNEEYLMKHERKEAVMKWFENSPYGISFKVLIEKGSKENSGENKYMAINLSDTGRIDYKISWKEEEMLTIDDVSKTYKYIRKIVQKINSENVKYHMKLNNPKEEDFKFAFINTIQKFELPEDFTIDHNDLSEFSRYFFPYVALMIEPRKRQPKTGKSAKEKSKFGTYLRYKRVSKYDNKTKIEHRILFFIRNYEYDDQSLVNEISKEFNITETQALQEIESVRDKYPNIKKSRRILKKLENIPKYKSPGISIEIQGKTRTKYKMRTAGARDREQLQRITSFMNILIYLYVETYLYKKPERQKMKDSLKRLTKIAKRRNKVEKIVYYETASKNVKQMTLIDRKRLGSKSGDDQSQWPRDCQNYGDKKRRPQQIINVEELYKKGYVWKEKLGEYNFGHFERKVMVDADGNVDSKKPKKQVILRAIRLALDDGSGGENYIYYTCGPEDNGKQMYVGFLSKSKNPGGESAPCCFIKDHYLSKNAEKRNFFLKSIGVLKPEDDMNKLIGEQLYILQDSNKIQEGRFSFLPKYLDILMNISLENDKIIKNHYLVSTDGYYFKLGTKKDEYRYLNALGAVLDVTVEEFKKKFIKVLEADKNLNIFTSLNNGDIRAQFGTIDAYISYIKHNDYLEYPLLNDLICLPGVIREDGLNIVIFQKKLKLIRKKLEKEKVKESYYVVCQNTENSDNMTDPKRETVFIIRENKNYYPIIYVKKPDEKTKEVDPIKTFRYVDSPKNIIKHTLAYYDINCRSEFNVLIKDNVANGFNAKETNKILLGLNDKQYAPKYQVIDARFKCKYLITQSGYIIPVIPSGSVPTIQILSSVEKYVKDFQTTVQYLRQIEKLTASKSRLPLKPVGVYYISKKEKSYSITAIMTENQDVVPVVQRILTNDYIKKEKLLIQNKPNDDEIDKEITKGSKNIVIDDRIYSVAKNRVEVEMYQLFRFHLSYFLNYVPTGQEFKKKIEDITASKLDKKVKRIEYKKLLYQMSDKSLYDTFLKLIQRENLDKIRGGDDVTHMRGGMSAPLKNSYHREDMFALCSGRFKHDVHLCTLFPINSGQSGGGCDDSSASEESEASGESEEESGSVQVIPEDFRSKQSRVKRSEYEEIPDPREFDYTEKAPPDNTAPDAVTAIAASRGEPPIISKTHFPKGSNIWVEIVDDSKRIDYPSFELKNTRELCYSHNNRDACKTSQFCTWSKSQDMCLFKIQRKMFIDCINKVAEEFVQDEYKAHEILRKGEYFVSDIVDYNVFTERPGERIVMSSNINLNKILSQIFGKENIPKAGKRRNKLDIIQNYDQMNADNPLKDINNWYIQNIIDNNNTVFRAFANSYYWLKRPYSETVYRNLGYYSAIQTNLSNIYKNQVMDWLRDPDNTREIESFKKHIPSKLEDFIVKLSTEVVTFTNGVAECYILSKIYGVTVYIYNQNHDVHFVLHPTKGLIHDHTESKKPYDLSKIKESDDNIHLRMTFHTSQLYPDRVEVMFSKRVNEN